MRRESRPAGPSSFELLRTYLEKRAAYTSDEIDFLRSFFVPRSLRKGEFLQRTGERARYAAFVARGCLRSYVIDHNGKEHIVQFAPEDWWIADSESLMTGSPCTLFIEALESSDVLLVDGPSHQRMMDEVPAYAASFRVGILRHVAAKDQRIVASLKASAEERYLGFVARYPSILRRVPQRMLASYLGISPETLSRVRRKLSRRGTKTTPPRAQSGGPP